ncbi:transformer-2 protein [Klebsormidium nitens]|uniref:Transformer-2 protein n=1 Tax=Klebsormidium nitens TaxID=105231 RepID=A0A1Y1HYT6_KLENI|nr:transformer-2 protein [Klebsormidium nitens]|eukprot:GAQ83353.1 transformer-2 protein [Klebsormidium nitens]
MSATRSPAPDGSPENRDRSPSPKQEEAARSRSPTPQRSPSRERRDTPERRDRSRTPDAPRRTRSPDDRRRSRTPERRGRSRSRSPAANGGGRGRSAENPGTNLYVTGLSTRVTEEELERYFSKEGKVADARIVRDPRTQESRGFGFITMATREDADAVVRRVNGKAFEGRLLTVEKAKRARERTPTPGQYRGVRGAHETAPPPRSSRYESDRYDRRSDRDDRYGRSYDRHDRYDDKYDRRRRSPDYGHSRRERSPYDRDRGYYRR